MSREKDGKIYDEYCRIGWLWGYWKVRKEVFPSGKTNTKEATEYIIKTYPAFENNFLLVYVKRYDAYNLFVERETLKQHEAK